MTMEARKQWGGILNMLKENNCQIRALYWSKISSKNENEIKHQRIDHQQTLTKSNSEGCTKRKEISDGSSKSQEGIKALKVVNI